MSMGIDNLDQAVGKILRDYGDVVYRATEDGLDAAEKVLINNLRQKSPDSKRGSITEHYAKSWKAKPHKYKLRRYVGNTKMVKGKKGQADIPLSNILEYASNSSHKGLIQKIYNESLDEMAAVVVATIKKE